MGPPRVIDASLVSLFRDLLVLVARYRWEPRVCVVVVEDVAGPATPLQEEITVAIDDLGVCVVDGEIHLFTGIGVEVEQLLPGTTPATVS